ncbi:MAG: glycine zipper 2TM domain-containing protein [Caulobacter sp.]|nr:glycine zipper 2TM domain-containing protein [Caulobacter sp.]
MKTRSILTRGVAGLAAITMVAGLAAGPTVASAQTYATEPAPAYGGGYRYDACQRDRTNRGTGGALVGAGLGALAGGNVAARGNRTEGAVLGGLLGAIVGANVGRTAAACEPGTYSQGYAPAPRAGYDGYQGGQDGYQQGAYDDRYGDDGYDDGYATPVADGPTADGCTLAESPIYLPDGRVQKRFVRVCRDASGHYQVVD